MRRTTRHPIDRLAVFCGSSHGVAAAYAEGAARFGQLLAERGIGLVYGGGKVGLMGVVADAVLAAGGEVIGVLPRALDRREVAHHGLTELRIVSSMHERKQTIHELSRGFVALPGGLGTFEELLETLTWMQLGLHQHPCGLLNLEGYYDPLLALLDHATEQGFIRPEHRRLLIGERAAEPLLDRFATFEAPRLVKWISEEEV